MIVVTMGNRNEVETFQVNAERGCVVSKVGAVAASVEKNAPAVVLDENGIPPAAASQIQSSKHSGKSVVTI